MNLFINQAIDDVYDVYVQVCQHAVPTQNNVLETVNTDRIVLSQLLYINNPSIQEVNRLQLLCEIIVDVANIHPNQAVVVGVLNINSSITTSAMNRIMDVLVELVQSLLKFLNLSLSITHVLS